VYLGFGYIELGQFERAAEVLQNAFGAAERLGLPAVAANALHNLGWAQAVLGNPRLGRETEERALAMFHALGDARKESQCNYYLARITLEAKDPVAAEAAARRSVEWTVAAHDSDVSVAYAILARALLDQGRVNEALDAAREAMRRLSDAEVTSHEGEVRLMYAEALRAAGDPAALDAIRAAHVRLQERAQRIHNQARRDSFLTFIPEHGRTVRLYKEWAA
jgi:tetratricopeptide (TPR) repeat protein